MNKFQKMILQILCNSWYTKFDTIGIDSISYSASFLELISENNLLVL